MGLSIEHLHDLRNGRRLCGFFVRNGAGKAMAVGSNYPEAPFLVMQAPRYERDSALVAAIERLTGIAARIGKRRRCVRCGRLIQGRRWHYVTYNSSETEHLACARRGGLR